MITSWVGAVLIPTLAGMPCSPWFWFCTPFGTIGTFGTAKRWGTPPLWWGSP
jgi:hypothetical protein